MIVPIVFLGRGFVAILPYFELEGRGTVASLADAIWRLGGVSGVEHSWKSDAGKAPWQLLPNLSIGEVGCRCMS